MSLFFCVTFLAIVFASYYYMTKNFKFWINRGVKEIRPFPFFGNFGKYFFSKTTPGILIKNFYDQSENQPYVGFYSFNRPCLLLRDTKIIKKIFITDFMYFSDKFMRSSKKDRLSNESLPFLKNPQWKLWRSKLTPAFSPGKLRNGFRDLQEISKEIDHYLDLEGLENVDIDIKEFLAKYTTEIVGKTAYGIKLNSFHPGALFRKFGKQMFGEYGWKRSIELACIFLAPHFTDFFDFRFFEKVSSDFFKKEFAKILTNRKDSKIKRGDFADLLLEIMQEDKSISFEQVISQALVFFNAGFDTTSTVMSFSLKELALNLDIQIKLRSEILDAMQGQEITYETIKNLKYLEMVILETLRLHPTVPTIDRMATMDYTIEETGLTIEKGTPVFISLLGLHYDPKYFKNPEVFDPERFSEHNETKNPAYMPFGIGPRKCIAYQQGLMQTKYGVAYLISKYEITLSNTTEVNSNSKVYFTAGKGGLYLNMRKI